MDVHFFIVVLILLAFLNKVSCRGSIRVPTIGPTFQRIAKGQVLSFPIEVDGMKKEFVLKPGDVLEEVVDSYCSSFGAQTRGVFKNSLINHVKQYVGVKAVNITPFSRFPFITISLRILFFLVILRLTQTITKEKTPKSKCFVTHITSLGGIMIPIKSIVCTVE